MEYPQCQGVHVHMGTFGAPDPCDDMSAREAGRPADGIDRYKAIAMRQGHPAIWAEKAAAGPMGRSTHHDSRGAAEMSKGDVIKEQESRC